VNIEVMEPRPVSDFVGQAMEFPVSLSINDLESILAVDGLLLAEDGKIVASLSQFEYNLGRGTHEMGRIGALGTQHDKDIQRQRDCSISVIAFLSNEALNHIDNVRDKNRKKDVVFKLRLRVRTLISQARIPPLHLVGPKEHTLAPFREKDESILTYKYEHDYHPPVENLWVISGGGTPGPIFLEVRDVYQEIPKTIASSDWVNDFAPQLGIGRFITIELPLPSPVAINKEFAERLNKATETLQKMEEEVKKGEWNEVIQNSRPVAELLRDEVMVSSVLAKHGFTEEATGSLLGTIRNLFDYSSKFIHKVEKDGTIIPAEIKAEKEDAYLIYSVSIGLLNLLTQKVKKGGNIS